MAGAGVQGQGGPAGGEHHPQTGPEHDNRHDADAGQG